MNKDTKIAIAWLAYYAVILVAPVKHIDGYNMNRFGWDTRISGPGIEGTLVDYDNDRIPDRKYIFAGGGFHGGIRIDKPITERDKQIFYDVTSKLK